MEKQLCVATLCIVIAVAAFGQSAERTETVHFLRGTSSTTIKGTIKGYAGVNYLLGAKADQAVSISFKPSNGSCYFNVWAPGADSAMYMGETSGNEFKGKLPADCSYKIQVYLMRNAARRQESCRYTLSIGIE
jgi:hypothetical protein